MKDTHKRVLRAKDGSQHIVVEREITVGRDAGCDEVLSKGQTSRRHATLSPNESGVLVTDLDSTNGTYINGRRIKGGELAKNGDEIRFDTVTFTLNVSDMNAGDATMIRPLKADATMLRPAETPPAQKTAKGSASAAAGRSQPEQRAATQPRPQAEQKVAPRRENSPPPSWALNRQQSVDGTQILSDSMISNLAAVASNKVETEVVTVPTLIGQSDPIKGMRFQMVADSGAGAVNQWTVGRSDQADIMINHNSVSTQHAQIINEGARWKLVDMMSANGTYVNGTKGLTSYLQNGDTIKFGQVETRFMLAGNQAAAAATQSGQAQAARQSSPLKLAAISFAVTAVLIIAVVFLFG